MIYMDNVSAGVVLPPLVSVSLGWVEPSLLELPPLQGPSSLDPLLSLPLAPPRLRPLLLNTTRAFNSVRGLMGCSWRLSFPACQKGLVESPLHLHSLAVTTMHAFYRCPYVRIIWFSS